MNHKTVKTFEDACKALAIDPKALPQVSMLPAAQQKAIVAHYKLVIIAQALNDGWQPNWSDSSEYKYFPWFKVNATAKTPSGSGLSFGVCGTWITATDVGSRLCFKTRELAEYAGKKFKALYEQYFLIK